MGSKTYCVYMMANRPRGAIYIGVTGDLGKRVYQHREGLIEGFTKRYGLKQLVWFEAYDEIEAAIRSEKRLKRYKRDWKIELIEQKNPQWVDLFPSLSP